MKQTVILSGFFRKYVTLLTQSVIIITLTPGFWVFDPNTWTVLYMFLSK